ncbi:hypothetical protein BDV98DRAFT_632206, partial [Pterulicium gracile]
MASFGLQFDIDDRNDYARSLFMLDSRERSSIHMLLKMYQLALATVSGGGPSSSSNKSGRTHSEISPPPRSRIWGARKPAGTGTLAVASLLLALTGDDTAPARSAEAPTKQRTSLTVEGSSSTPSSEIQE